MDWNELKAYLWKPVTSLPERCVPLDECIFQVGTAYVYTVDHLRDLTAVDEPVISLVIWAPSVGAVKRALNREIESDDLFVGVLPPEMRIAPEAVTYGQILAAAKAQGTSMMESASYRIATDGAFVHRCLESRRYCAYFRSRKDDEGEEPYVVAVSA